MKKLTIGVGAAASGAPFEQGCAAARAARAKAGGLPPALAIVAAHGPQHAAEILRGAREVLGDCPLVGAVSESADLCGVAAPRPGVQVFLVCSRHLHAKVGVGTGGGGWEHEAREAFGDSFVPPVSALPEHAPERDLYRWYLYRQPSLVLALVLSSPGERRRREREIADFLKRRLKGRTPILFCSLAGEAGAEPAGLADGRVVTSGVILTMVKTDLKFSLERFHSFEPIGTRLVITRAEGDRVFECNGRPALEAYREALGIEPEAELSHGKGAGAFALFPLAHRGPDGRYTLLVPEELGLDGSMRFPATVEPDRVLYPMKAVPAPDLLRASPAGGALLSDLQRLAAAVIIRDPALRDLPAVLPPPGPDAAVVQPIEVACGRELSAYISPAEGEGNAGHLLLAFHPELDPFAVAAAENERLLQQIVALRDLHQKIFDSIGYGIAVIDAARRVVFCNNTYRHLLGGGEPAYLEGNVCPWSLDSTAVCSSCACEEAIGQHAPVTREVVRVEEGKTHWYRVDTFPLRDTAGKVASAIEVMRDVTEFKDLHFTLEREQRKMEIVLRGMGETLYIVNHRYELQFFHRGAFPVEAVPEGDGRVRTCYEALFHRDAPCSWCRMHHTALSGSVERRVATLTDAAGEERSYQVTFSPWHVGQGDKGAVICLLVDISAQKRLEQQMVRSEKLNSLSILSAGMAHELNNPLGAINFNLEILKRRERDPEYMEVLESIRKDVLRINRIVGSLLSFSRSNAVSSGRLSLPEVVETSLELFQVVIERRQIEVRKSWAEGLPQVWGNAQDLQQVFINLIANAVDAMPSGGTIEIAVGLEEQGAEQAGSKIAVVYDSADHLSLLRPLADEVGWEVRFLRGDEEAIDFLRQSPHPPEVVLLDYADANPDRIGFFAMMVKECAPEAMILVVADAGDQLPGAQIPGVAGVVPRAAGAAPVLEQVRALVAGLRARRRRPADIVVRFTDTGMGMPPDVQERIFDPFYTTKEAKGTGLGLSVVHKIVENHGGSIRVGSTPGKGTHFTITFPQAQAGAATGVFRLPQDNSLGRVVG